MGKSTEMRSGVVEILPGWNGLSGSARLVRDSVNRPVTKFISPLKISDEASLILYLHRTLY